MSKYIAIYEALCPGDKVSKDDPRRAAIISEMRMVHRAKMDKAAAEIIWWWGWISTVERDRWVKRARRMMK